MAFCIAAPSCGESLVGRYENSKTDYTHAAFPPFIAKKKQHTTPPLFLVFRAWAPKRQKKISILE